jgi:hypothetical protein
MAPVTDLCLAADRCVDFDRRSGESALAESGPLCEGCLLAGERAVGQLVLDFRDLEQHLPPSLGQWGDGQPAGRDEHRIPLNLAVDELQRQIWHVLTCWEEVVREVDRLSESVTRGVRAGWAVQAAAQVLQPRVRLLARVGAVELADYPALDEDEACRWEVIEHVELAGWRAVLDFRRLHDRAHSLLGLTSAGPERIQLVPCRDCDTLALYRVSGNDRVFCGACPALLSAEEFRRWVGLLAEHARAREVA